MKNKIAELRKKARITQAELAKIAKISRPYLSEIERGISNPSVVIAMRICNVLGTSFEKVFYEETGTEGN